MPPLRVAVNLSPRQFKGDNLAKRLSRIVDETGIAPGRLELELTESLLKEDAPVSSAMLDELRITSQHLHRRLRDGLLVPELPQALPFGQPQDRPLLRPRHRHRLERRGHRNLDHQPRPQPALKVIAEGVETEEQLAYLRERGCDIVQGFYFSEPVPVGEFSEFVRGGKPLPNASLRE